MNFDRYLVFLPIFSIWPEMLELAILRLFFAKRTFLIFASESDNFRPLYVKLIQDRSYLVLTKGPPNALTPSFSSKAGDLLL